MDKKKLPPRERTPEETEEHVQLAIKHFDMIKIADVKAISISTMLLGLNLQGDITTPMYEYLNDEILWILHNVIREDFSDSQGEDEV